ncbi:hypothetical protein LTR36_004221 [Oleoguttula mirabilis]|uniref:C2H2-type domain-containing protein n=1 Tax=Oleoguttula mirabilis TaxID=1507867 RepID=A0AAV9JGL5_9PEZI|nr:hypothetical protein LTR36_004221 [Oleoguttula mirabilis]
MQEHRAVHTKEKSFHCAEDGCEKMFKTELKSARHFKACHVANPKAKCDICGDQFCKPSYMKRHRSTAHPASTSGPLNLPDPDPKSSKQPSSVPDSEEAMDIGDELSMD